jgi:hypothetical protein
VGDRERHAGYDRGVRRISLLGRLVCREVARARAALLASCLVPAIAMAKPLPKGLTISVVKEHVVASRDGETVPLLAYDAPVDKLAKAELDDSGETLVLALSVCNGGFESVDQPARIPLAKVQAKLENMLGMRAHLKNRYGDAIPHFASAAKLDPDAPVYATNLLSAQSMGGKLDDADRTIATYASRNRPWFAWRLAVDSDLAALAGRASTNLGPGKAGKATSNLGRAIAYSPLGLAATEQEVEIYVGIPDRKVADALLSSSDEVVAGDGRKLELGDKPQLVTGKKTKEPHLEHPTVAVGFVPGALVEMHKSDKRRDNCAGDGRYRIELTAFSTP